MCGDIEEDTTFDDLIFGRFSAFARNSGVVVPENPKALDDDLTQPDGRSAYMSRLFHDAMLRAAADAAAAAEGSRADAIASQAVVFARLAGVLVAQLPPESDVFRAAMEAFMHGSGEPARREAEHRHHHHHDHHHEH